MSIKSRVKRNLRKFVPRALRKRFGLAHSKRRRRHHRRY
jgi:hypothetical protein